MRISDWSSDVCSSDLENLHRKKYVFHDGHGGRAVRASGGSLHVAVRKISGPCVQVPTASSWRRPRPPSGPSPHLSLSPLPQDRSDDEAHPLPRLPPGPARTTPPPARRPAPRPHDTPPPPRRQH